MKTPVSRRPRRSLIVFGAAALTVGLVSGCASGASSANTSDQDLTTIRVALGWVPNVEFAGFWIADDAGYYTEEGLKVEFVPGGPDAPSPESAVAAGTADIGLSPDTKTMIDSAASNDFQILGAVYQQGPGCLLSLSDEPVTEVSDLPGKTFLAQDEAVVKALFDVNDLPADYTFVPTSFDPGPLVAGDGDAYTAYITNQAVAMELQYGLKEGVDFTCTLYSELNYPTYSSIIFGKKAYLDDNRDAVVGFLRASVRGWLDNAEDPEAAPQLATDTYGADLGLNIDQQIAQNKRQVPLTQTDFTDENGLLRIDETHLSGPIYAGLEASGSTDLPPVDTIVDQTFLDAVFTDGLKPKAGA